MADVHENDCFVLGSGFSKAIGQEMPTISDLTNEVKHSVSQELLDRLGKFKDENIESILSFLLSDFPWQNDVEHYQHLSDFEFLSGRVSHLIKQSRMELLRKVNRGRKELDDWIKDLFSIWHEQQLNVITLNYDTCVERIFITKFDEHFEDDSSPRSDDLYNLPLTPAFQRQAGVWGSTEKKTFTYLKLHGSTNWFYSGLDEFSGEPIYTTKSNTLEEDDSEREHLNLLQDKTPLIIPPVTNKSNFFGNQILNLLWRKAYKSLKRARNIYFIGYSLPETDLTIRFLLNDIDFDKLVNVYIIDPNADELKNKYNSLFEGEHADINDEINYSSVNTEDLLSQFVSDLDR